jgi:hypothetical protein
VVTVGWIPPPSPPLSGGCSSDAGLALRPIWTYFTPSLFAAHGCGWNYLYAFHSRRPHGLVGGKIVFLLRGLLRYNVMIIEWSTRWNVLCDGRYFILLCVKGPFMFLMSTLHGASVFANVNFLRWNIVFRELFWCGSGGVGASGRWRYAS